MTCDKCEGCKNKYEPKETNKSCLPPISNMFIGLTEDCNMRCRYCFVSHNPKKIDYETAFEAVEWLAKQQEGHFNIDFFGGEPTLRWHDVIVPLVVYAKSKYGDRVSFGMTSNCVLMDREKLEFMKKFGIGLLFSIDGCKECQDINRPLRNGESSFDILEPKIPLILEYYPSMTFRMTNDADTVQYFFKNHKFAIESGFINTFSAINQFAKWTDEQFKILEDQYYKLADYYIELIENGKVVHFNPLERMFYMVERVQKNQKNPKLESSNLGFGKCGISANGSLIVATDGKLYSCQETYTNEDTRDFFCIGNIKEGVNESRRLDIISCFNPKNIRSDKYDCSECKLQTVCDGGCLIRNYDVYRDFNVVPYPYCKEQQIMFDVCLYIYDRLKNNELFIKNFRSHNNGRRC